MIGKICGTGSYIPPKILSNDDLSEMVETSDEWIRERTGVRNRHIAGEDTSSFMASEAAKRAVENAGISPEEIDLIIDLCNGRFLFPGCDLSERGLRSAEGDRGGSCFRIRYAGGLYRICLCVSDCTGIY